MQRIRSAQLTMYLNERVSMQNIALSRPTDALARVTRHFGRISMKAV